jgi:hypothetical protein
VGHNSPALIAAGTGYHTGFGTGYRTAVNVALKNFVTDAPVNWTRVESLSFLVL